MSGLLRLTAVLVLTLTAAPPLARLLLRELQRIRRALAGLTGGWIRGFAVTSSLVSVVVLRGDSPGMAVSREWIAGAALWPLNLTVCAAVCYLWIRARRNRRLEEFDELIEAALTVRGTRRDEAIFESDRPRVRWTDASESDKTGRHSRLLSGSILPWRTRTM